MYAATVANLIGMPEPEQSFVCIRCVVVVALKKCMEIMRM